MTGADSSQANAGTGGKAHLGLLVAICVCILLFALAGFMVHSIDREVRQKTIEAHNAKQLQLADLSASAISNFFRTCTNKLVVLSNDPDVVELNDFGKEKLESIARVDTDQVSAYTRMDRDGIITFTAPYNEAALGADISEQQHVKDVMETRQPVTSDCFPSKQGYPAIAIHVPVFRDGEFDGSVAMLVPFGTIIEDFVSGTTDVLTADNLSGSNHCLVLSKDGRELFSSMHDAFDSGDNGTLHFYREHTSDSTTFVSYAEDMLGNPEGSGWFLADLDNYPFTPDARLHGAFNRVDLGTTFWAISFASPESEILASLAGFRFKLAIVLSLAFIVLLGFGIFGARAWSRMLEQSIRLDGAEALRVSQQEALDARAQYETVVNQIPEVVWSFESDFMGHMTSSYISPVADRMFGVEPGTIGNDMMKFGEMVLEEDRHTLWNSFAEILSGRKQDFDMEYRLRRGDGQLVWLYSNGRAYPKDGGGYVLYGTTTDITRQKDSEEKQAALEAQLRQTMKLEALGKLAGGIAHDFNNILHSISGNAELLRESLPEGSEDRDCLEEINLASKRATELVSQILTFARKDQKQRKVLDISELMRDSLKLLRSTIPTSIEMDVQLNAGQSMVLADPIDIHQILMNICSNAAHEMQDSGGRLEIRLEQAPDTGADDNRESNEAESGRVMICIRDTGGGISPDVIEHIFDPFFTTKDAGQGTGMGLAVVHGIVKGLGGSIEVDSRQGKGTEFRVLLPTTEGLPDGEDTDGTELPTGSESILLVDDEQSVLRMLERSLGSLGYTLTSCSNGADALETYGKDPAAFDVVLTDNAMPRMNGADLASAIREIDPEQKIILCTGYSDRFSEQDLDRLGLCAFLYKPVPKNRLASCLRQVLDSMPEGAAGGSGTEQSSGQGKTTASS